MSDLSISLEWNLQEEELKPDVFSKNHKIEINDNFFNAGSAPEYGGRENEINPEQSLAAAISSCHMMTFLALASKMKWPVKSYKDKAHAFLGKNTKGKMCVNKIELNPQIIFDKDFSVSKEDMDKMQDRSHRYCFVANSLSDDVEIKINI
ncbi:MAG: OsmC family peroxiredoxin [Pelagibacteraceae bacterium]|jgi:organic hydroperoxide reductase OsmC/OhrA|nr:OsmC family peroxiredoxin [Pelagibacteraceae bacterium]MBT4646226.1 OsmC family peroxiredoxin [Pelagibacteraceae bacterium]MBT4951511.1 OsmC family peroxiredoxin [Pelagibacteraceae bacterium]MBT5215001.1 OsmC family peroxiredoxin [Pelagibacteraceae bacterium]MBT6198222.1 OsmC family peroxiredoxin [Pelagibacteraceae bacterium]